MANFNNDTHYLLGVAGIVVTVASIVGVIQKSYILLKVKGKSFGAFLWPFHKKNPVSGSFDTEMNIFYVLENE